MIETGSALKKSTFLESKDGKYKIIDVLGQGGFGITYLVIGEIKVGNVTTEAKFAIKEHYPPAFSIREGDKVVPKHEKVSEYNRSKADFIAEANKLHSLGTENDNIVKVNEVFETNGTAYYVMQYINGASLSSYVKSKKKLDYTEALSILSPIIDAVGFLHKSRINHLDIKPDNIMLHEGSNGRVPVLIDFGLSVHFKKNGDKTSPKGVQGVSEGYSPLEQYVGVKEFNPATDIYALAATLLFTMTGEKPSGAAELKLSDIRSKLAKTAPPNVINGICNALHKSYEDRTSSVSKLKSDLGLTSNSEYNDTVPISVDDAKKKKIIYIIFSLFVVTIIVLLIIFWPTSEEPLLDENTQVENVNASEEQVPIENIETSNKEQAPEAISPSTQPSIPEHTVKLEATATNNPSPLKEVAPSITSGTLYLGYGEWTGGTRNGNPDGKGKIVFSSSHKVHKNLPYMANPGDYFIGTFDDGQLISGKLYDSDGNLLETIIP